MPEQAARLGRTPCGHQDEASTLRPGHRRRRPRPCVPQRRCEDPTPTGARCSSSYNGHAPGVGARATSLQRPCCQRPGSQPADGRATRCQRRQQRVRRTPTFKLPPLQLHRWQLHRSGGWSKPQSTQRGQDATYQPDRHRSPLDPTAPEPVRETSRASAQMGWPVPEQLRRAGRTRPSATEPAVPAARSVALMPGADVASAAARCRGGGRLPWWRPAPHRPAVDVLRRAIGFSGFAPMLVVAAGQVRSEAGVGLRVAVGGLPVRVPGHLPGAARRRHGASSEAIRCPAPTTCSCWEVAPGPSRGRRRQPAGLGPRRLPGWLRARGQRWSRPTAHRVGPADTSGPRSGRRWRCARSRPVPHLDRRRFPHPVGRPRSVRRRRSPRSSSATSCFPERAARVGGATGDPDGHPGHGAHRRPVGHTSRCSRPSGSSSRPTERPPSRRPLGRRPHPRHSPSPRVSRAGRGRGAGAASGPAWRPAADQAVAASAARRPRGLCLDAGVLGTPTPRCDQATAPVRSRPSACSRAFHVPDPARSRAHVPDLPAGCASSR